MVWVLNFSDLGLAGGRKQQLQTELLTEFHLKGSVGRWSPDLTQWTLVRNSRSQQWVCEGVGVLVSSVAFYLCSTIQISHSEEQGHDYDFKGRVRK